MTQSKLTEPAPYKKKKQGSLHPASRESARTPDTEKKKQGSLHPASQGLVQTPDTEKTKQGSLHPASQEGAQSSPLSDSLPDSDKSTLNGPPDDKSTLNDPHDDRSALNDPPDEDPSHTSPAGGETGGREPLLLEDWIRRTGLGEKEAFCSLYVNTRRILFSYALSLLHRREDAEDAMQDTYLKIRSAAHLYRPMGKPLAWMITIEKNVCLMRLREQSRFGIREDLENAYGKMDRNSPPPGMTRPPSTRPDVIEDRLLLQDTLRILSREEASIVLLHASAGLRHRETAELLGLPLNTVLSKYSRALEKLRRKLQDTLI